MDCCRAYHDIMRMIFTCTPPAQRVKVTNACISFSFFGLFTAIFLSFIVDTFYAGGYGTQVKKAYTPSNCTLLSYSQIRAPSSLYESTKGLCIHRFEVLMLIPQPAGEEPQFQQTSILELTSGECTPESRKATNWPVQNSNSPDLLEVTGISFRRGKLRSRGQPQNQSEYSSSNAETRVCFFSKAINPQTVLTQNELFNSIPSPPSHLPSLPFFSSIFGSKTPQLPQDHLINTPTSDISHHTDNQPSLTTLAYASLTQPGGPMLRLVTSLSFFEWFLAIILSIFPAIILIPIIIWLPYLTYRGIRKIFCCCPRVEPALFPNMANLANLEDPLDEAPEQAEPPAERPAEIEETREQRRQRLEERREARRAAQRAEQRAIEEANQRADEGANERTNRRTGEQTNRQEQERAPQRATERQEPLTLGANGIWGGEEEEDEATMIAMQLSMIDAIYRQQGEQARERLAEANQREGRSNEQEQRENKNKEETKPTSEPKSIVEETVVHEEQPKSHQTQTQQTPSQTTVQSQPTTTPTQSSSVSNAHQPPEREMNDAERARLARLARLGL